MSLLTADEDTLFKGGGGSCLQDLTATGTWMSEERELLYQCLEIKEVPLAFK